MNLTFLGHNGWLLQADTAFALFDPIVVDGTGVGPEAGRIFPPRIAELSRMPVATSIFISHEHTDHFHLPSLVALPKHSRIILSLLIPQYVEDLLRQVGFSDIRRVPFSAPIAIGNVFVTLYNASELTAFWEKRVTQYRIASADGTDSLFMCVDAAISPRFSQDIQSQKIARPTAIAVSNNTDIPHEGHFATLDDFRPEKRSSQYALIGVKLLSALVLSHLPLGSMNCALVIAGGGYVKEGYIPPYSALADQRALAQIANHFSDNGTAIAPIPGTILNFRDGSIELSASEWIRTDTNAWELLIEAGKNPPSVPVPGFPHCISGFNGVSYENSDDCVIEASMQALATAWMLSDFAQEWYRSRDIADVNGLTSPFAFRLLRDRDVVDTYVLNASSGVFERSEEHGLMQLVERTMSGIVMNMPDFLAVSGGTLQIWDVAHGGIHAWYRGTEPFRSPITLLYVVLGEQVRPDLAKRALSLGLDRVHRNGSSSGDQR